MRRRYVSCEQLSDKCRADFRSRPAKLGAGRLNNPAERGRRDSYCHWHRFFLYIRYDLPGPAWSGKSRGARSVWSQDLSSPNGSSCPVLDDRSAALLDGRIEMIIKILGVPRGIRTPVTAVKGRCPGPTRRWGRLGQADTSILSRRGSTSNLSRWQTLTLTNLRCFWPVLVHDVQHGLRRVGTTEWQHPGTTQFSKRKSNDAQ